MQWRRGFLNHWVLWYFFVWKMSSLLQFLRCKCLASPLKIQKLLLLPVPTILTLAHSDYMATREDCFSSWALLFLASRPRLEMVGLKGEDGTPDHLVPKGKQPDLVGFHGQRSQRLQGISISGEVTIGSAHLYSTHCHSNHRKTNDLIPRIWKCVLCELSV